MSVKESRAQLMMLTKELRNEWLRTREHWQDAKCQQFDSDYMIPLREGVNGAGNVIEELEKLLTKIRKDCE
ncbi:MAG: hypothetical protein ACC661_12110 [Verrucomicrobiales bacterium]